MCKSCYIFGYHSCDVTHFLGGHQIQVDSKVSTIIGVLYKIKKKINVKIALIIYDLLLLRHISCIV